MIKTKIGVIGSGDVGQTLAKGFVRHEYDVVLGSNDAEKRAALTGKLSKARVGTFAEAAAFGEILVLAVKGKAAEAALKSAGIENLKGKLILDATNPIADAPPENGVLKFFTTLDSSLMERLQKIAPEAHFVKCFSSIGSAWMVNPNFGRVRPTMFICGNDAAAKKKAKFILDQFGFDGEDMGCAEAARAIEPLCMLWCIPGFLRNQWSHAFMLLKR